MSDFGHARGEYDAEALDTAAIAGQPAGCADKAMAGNGDAEGIGVGAANSAAFAGGSRNPRNRRREISVLVSDEQEATERCLDGLQCQSQRRSLISHHGI
jgi:hypothetical protein